MTVPQDQKEKRVDLRPIIEKLVSIEEPEGTVVTLALDVARSGILPEGTRVFLKDKVLAFLSSAAPPGPGGAWSRELTARIAKYVESELRPGANGLFLVAGPAHWEPVELGVPLRNFVHLGRAPYLAPLLDAVDRAPRAYVVRFDEREVVIEALDLGVWQELERLGSERAQKDVERLVSGRAALSRTGPRGGGSGTGGGSRDRFEKWVEDAGSETLARAARRVATLDAHARAAAVYVFGRKEGFATFRDHLPARLKERARHMGPVVLRQEDAWRQEVEKDLQAFIRDRVEGELLEFHERRAQGRLVALGPMDVLEQILVGKAARVYLDPQNSVPGVKCTSCGTRSPGVLERCDHCGGRSAPVSLTQEVIAHAVRHPPLSITFVPRPAKWLEALGGLAALVSRKGLRRRR